MQEFRRILGNYKVFKTSMQVIVLFVKVAEFIWSVAKFGNFESYWLWPTSKPTYIFGWAHELKSSKHIVLTSASICSHKFLGLEELSEDFGNTHVYPFVLGSLLAA